MSEQEITKEEFLKKYGKVWVCFSHYYKYSFSFKGRDPVGKTIVIHIGGCSEDIYRFEFDADRDYQVEDLDPVSGRAIVENTTIESFYDY